LVKLLIKVNVFLYRLTNGMIGGKLGRNSIMLLNSVGRKTGKLHTIPINYFRDGNNYYIVGSNWGREHHAGWYFNLKDKPETTIQIKNRVIKVQVREAAGEEYDRLWKSVTAQNSFYNNYQAHTQRKIPIMILTPHS
jgi:F420H(2)-dependent quinone reductase